jgi:hypothetical protein
MTLRALTILLGVIALLVLGSNLMFNLAIQKAVQNAGTSITGVPVQLAYSSLSFLSGDGGMGKLQWVNTKAGAPFLLTVKNIEVETEALSLFSDHVAIEKITLKRPTLFVQDIDGVRHWDAVLEQIRTQAAPEKQGILGIEGSDSASRTRFIIHTIVIEDASWVMVAQEKTEPVVIKDITIENIGAKGAEVSAAQAVEAVIQRLFADIPLQ